MACFRFGDCHCFIAAGLFLFGHVLSAIRKVRFQNELNEFGVEDVTYYNDLQPMQLASTWVTRFDTAGIENAAIFVTSAAWLFFAIAMIKLAWAISSAGTKQMGSSITIAVLAVAGSICELLSNLMYWGTKISMFHIVSTYELNDWIQLRGSGFEIDEFPDAPDRRALQQDTDMMDDPEDGSPMEDPNEDPDVGDDYYTEEQPQDFEDFGDQFEDYTDFGEQDNFDFEGLAASDKEGGDEFMIDGDYSNQDYDEDGLGWKTLELLNAVSNGMISIIDWVEYILIAAIMVTLFFAVRRGAALPKKLTYFGLVIAVISCLQLIMAIAAVDTWSVSNRIATALMAINQVVLLPIWLVWIGVQMKDLNESGIEISSVKNEADNDGFPTSFN